MSRFPAIPLIARRLLSRSLKIAAIVPEIELTKIPAQVLFAHVMVHAVDSAFQVGEERYLELLE